MLWLLLPLLLALVLPRRSIHARTNFEDLECLLSALARWLEGTTSIKDTNYAWCVGGSLDATLRARNPKTKGTHLLRFVLCDRNDWTGDRKTVRSICACTPSPHASQSVEKLLI